MALCALAEQGAVREVIQIAMQRYRNAVLVDKKQANPAYMICKALSMIGWHDENFINDLFLNGSVSEKKWGLLLLAYSAKPEKACDALIALFMSGEVALRSEIIIALGKIPSPRSQAFLISIISSLNELERGYVASAFCTYPVITSASKDLLREWINEESAQSVQTRLNTVRMRI